MTSLGFPGLSTQSVSVFLAFFCQKTPKRTGMTSLGFPGLSSQSDSGFFGPVRPENPKTDWDDKPGLPSQGCHPSPFRGYLAFFGQKTPKRTGMTSLPSPFQDYLALVGQKTPKRTGMTSLGFPGLSSQSVSGFFGPFRPENPEMDWDNKLGLPRVVILIRFKVFCPFSARKPRNGVG